MNAYPGESATTSTIGSSVPDMCCSLATVGARFLWHFRSDRHTIYARTGVEVVSTDFDAYKLLQVDPQADDIVVEAAFRALARRYHPDNHAGDAARMADINKAYDLLRTPLRSSLRRISLCPRMGPPRPQRRMPRPTAMAASPLSTPSISAGTRAGA